jgi:hypothetical protein
MSDQDDTYNGIFWVRSKDFDMRWEAATPGESCDEIKRLRAENARLREALTNASSETLDAIVHNGIAMENLLKNINDGLEVKP